MFFHFFSRSWSDLTDIYLNRVLVNEVKLYLEIKKVLRRVRLTGQRQKKEGKLETRWLKASIGGGTDSERSITLYLTHTHKTNQ